MYGTQGRRSYFFLPGHYRGTIISNGAHLTVAQRTRKACKPGLFSNPCFRFQSLPPIQHASLRDALAAQHCEFLPYDLCKFI